MIFHGMISNLCNDDSEPWVALQSSGGVMEEVCAGRRPILA